MATGATGAALYVLFGSTVLDTDYRDFGTSEEVGLVEDTAGADANRHYLSTVKDGSSTITILIQTADTTTWGAVAPATEGTLEWGLEGTASGKPKHQVLAIVQDRGRTMNFEDVTTADITFQYQGAVTDTTY